MQVKRLSLLLFAIVLMTTGAFAAVSQDGVWSETDDSTLALRPAERLVIPVHYRSFRLDVDAMRAKLKTAPPEFSGSTPMSGLVLSLPMPDGTFQRFLVEHSPIVEAGLAAKYPELNETYRGQGIDDPTATVRLDFLPMGFHAMVLTAKGSVLIDPYFRNGDLENYIVYDKHDVAQKGTFECHFNEKESLDQVLSAERLLADRLPFGSLDNVISGTQLRTYRLALAATFEYSAAVGTPNTIANALAAQTLIMNRVNGVYERDVAIRMVTVANNNLIVYAADQMCGGVACTGANDPYTNEDGGAMLSQNQTNINAVIGSANYDIGHVFSTGGGGVAFLGVPCGGSKAGGVTGLTNPVGDPFAIDYVAHEMGHQWGANHTFNSTTSSCGGGNRSAGSAYEPGSGITIMAYAGICGNQNLARNSIDTFHVKSLEVIVAYSQTGNGNTCAAVTSTGNTPPTVAVVGGPNFNIPKQTPFALTATGSDTNGDALTYDWQEYTLGASTTTVPNTDATGARPILRPYLPTASPTRYFPSLEYILNNANVPPNTKPCGTSSTCLTGELLPQIGGRTITFQVVARDNRANGGGINSATATVAVDATAGPFAVTAPNTGVTVNGGSSQTITWNVSGTTAAPVSAANVRISLSTDGGQTFPTVLSASTANDGSESVTVPNVSTTTARIKVEAVGNIFFDISDANFTIVPSANVRRFMDFDGDSKTDISIFRPSVGEWWYLRSTDGGNGALQFGSSTDIRAAADFTGDGKTDITFWRPSTGEWFVLRSENFTFLSFPFGSNGDVPSPADFDGDGKADPTVFRPSTGTWFISRSTDNGTTIANFGLTTDRPVPADYDGDGKDDIAIFRPSVSEWWIQRSTAGLIAAQFGSTGDQTVQGDYTGDGKADIAIYRPSTGAWFILRSEDGSFFTLPFGSAGDIPAPGDYDGDGKYDTAIFRPSTGTWFVQRTTAGTLITPFGSTGDLPVPNSYVR